MTLTGHLSLHPKPMSAWVLLTFYGGPMDGEQQRPMSVEQLRSRIPLTGGKYELVGFRASNSNLPDDLKKYCADYAVYEWT